MNEYRWNDLYVGLKHEFETSFSADDAKAFAELSGDVNPLHASEAYAIESGFPGPVLFGMLTSSLYSQLVGVYLPGKLALLQGIDIDFSAPCYPGDRLRVAGVVVFLSEAYRRFEIRATIRTDDNKLVSKATIRAGFHVK
jgi:3-hydroxybutyryl-CoA dehydratase